MTQPCDILVTAAAERVITEGGVTVSYFERVQDLQRLFRTGSGVFHRLEGILDGFLHRELECRDGGKLQPQPDYGSL